MILEGYRMRVIPDPRSDDSAPLTVCSIGDEFSRFSLERARISNPLKSVPSLHFSSFAPPIWTNEDQDQVIQCCLRCNTRLSKVQLNHSTMNPESARVNGAFPVNGSPLSSCSLASKLVALAAKVGYCTKCLSHRHAAEGCGYQIHCSVCSEIRGHHNRGGGSRISNALDRNGTHSLSLALVSRPTGSAEEFRTVTAAAGICVNGASSEELNRVTETLSDWSSETSTSERTSPTRATGQDFPSSPGSSESSRGSCLECSSLRHTTETCPYNKKTLEDFEDPAYGYSSSGSSSPISSRYSDPPTPDQYLEEPASWSWSPSTSCSSRSDSDSY